LISRERRALARVLPRSANLAEAPHKEDLRHCAGAAVGPGSPAPTGAAHFAQRRDRGGLVRVGAKSGAEKSANVIETRGGALA
jgi:hypothetical protein